MSRSYSVPVLHQQAGAMTPQAFAEREGLTLPQVMRCIRSGQILGAQQDGRSKRWSIYPPAKLLRDKPRKVLVSAELPAHSQISAPAAAAQREQAGLSGEDFGQHAPQVKAEGIYPPASPVLSLPPALPRAACEHGEGLRVLPEAYSSAKARKACQWIRNEVARRYASGSCYLVLSRQEFRQAYRAVEQERNRKRKAVGKGLAKLQDLRASDSLWEILRRINGRLA